MPQTSVKSCKTFRSNFKEKKTLLINVNVDEKESPRTEKSQKMYI